MQYLLLFKIIFIFMNLFFFGGWGMGGVRDRGRMPVLYTNPPGAFPTAVPSPKQQQGLNKLAGDMEDDVQGMGNLSKLSDSYSATLPSVDSAVESWDSSTIDTAISGQGEDCGTDHA